eukprot:1175892-Prorocentrum_minimum.AAC.2
MITKKQEESLTKPRVVRLSSYTLGYAIGYLRLFASSSGKDARTAEEKGREETSAASQQATPSADDDDEATLEVPGTSDDPPDVSRPSCLGPPPPPLSPPPSPAPEKGAAPEGAPPPPLPPAPPPEEDGGAPTPVLQTRGSRLGQGRRRQRFPFGTICFDASCVDPYCPPSPALPPSQ